MVKLHWMVRLVRIIAILFVFFGCLMVFWYTPFYSNMMVKLLNTFVPVEVNQVAAKSQQNAALSESENLEPGSDLWIARQAYLKLMEQEISSKNTNGIAMLGLRYKALQEQIANEQQNEQDTEEKPVIPLLAEQTSSMPNVDQSAEAVKELLDLNNEDNKALMDEYIVFLKTHKIKETESEPDLYSASELAVSQVQEDMSLVQSENTQKNKSSSQPYAIVVLGGGLTLDKNQKDIIVNQYTKLRLETTLALEKKVHLPIVLSGVEAPYMQKWLSERGVEAKLLENRSMNTCENTRFSSLLLQKKGGAPTVLLITDRYHMPRTRRLFALNGIETIPVESPMPTPLTSWQPSQQNYNHSRRANYETLATIRDMLFGSSGCREVP
ncbi:YdcF family protein [Acinetobacter rongchengensis]|uniref:YdcF family protein n=1 Tax=Acinetobacter rongchengensis TaxID=2419601 RepID=A0A3A8EU69_9GAMM|nr:YdcF family protein [Acinetobacter rongchengensis]RKG37699.1 YdcF family protein [Acinetobacter rongchengensis]